MKTLALMNDDNFNLISKNAAVAFIIASSISNIKYLLIWTCLFLNDSHCLVQDYITGGRELSLRVSVIECYGVRHGSLLSLNLQVFFFFFLEMYNYKMKILVYAILVASPHLI